MSRLSDKSISVTVLEDEGGRIATLEAENARLRAALAEAESRAARESPIRRVADALPVLISYIDAEGRYRFNNLAYERWFGHPRRELLGRHMRDVLGDAAFDQVRPLVERVLAGEQVSVDRELRYRDGGPRSVHIEYVPDRAADGSVAGFYALIQDVSEAKRTEQGLRESEARFRTIADCAPAAVWVTNRDGIEFVNRAMVEQSGLPPEQLTGEAWMRLIHPDDLLAVLETRKAAWVSGASYEYEARFHTAAGDLRWMHVSCSPRRDEQGGLIGYVGMAVDVHEQRRAEAELRESEARFRAMADSAPAPVWVTNEQGIEFANRALSEFSGVPVEELVGDAWMRLCHQDDLAAVQARRAEAWRDQQSYGFEARFRRHDGEWRWLRATCRPREHKAGFLGYVGMALDVTDSRRAETELRAREALLQAMFDNAGVGMVLMNHDCIITRANAAFAAIFGREIDDLIGQCCLDLTLPEDLPANREALAALAAGAEAYAFEKRYHGKEGRIIWVRQTLSRVGDQLLAMVEDVTRRKQAEEQLRDSEQRFRDLAENIPTLCWMADEEGSTFWFNRRWYDYTGTTPEQMEGWGWRSVHDPTMLPTVEKKWRESIETGAPFELVFPLRGADGNYRSFLTRVVPLRDEAGKIVRWFGTNVDITEVKQLEDALRDESQRLETLNRIGMSLAPEFDLKRVVQMVTDAGVELTHAAFGAFFYNSVDSGDSYMLYTLSGIDADAFSRFPMPRKTSVFAPTFSGEGTIRSDDITKDERYGRNRPYKGMPEGHVPVASYLAVPVVSRSGEVLGGLFFGHPERGRFSERHETLIEGIAGQAAIAIDNARLFESAQREIAERTQAQLALAELNQSLEGRIGAAIAEREQAEAALRQAQKMEAVGQLTGGIAHDFNNLLTVIAGNLDLAERRLGPAADPRVLRAITNALVGAERAATLTQRLLAFSRRQPLAPRAVDANALITGMSELLHRTLGETVTVESDFAAPGVVEVDPNQLESALLNLAVNARDAMPDGGRLTFSTRPVRIDPAQACDDLPIGDYIRISVADTGQGMNADTVERAIEPFFTTKDVGKGTGLGLSMVYGFVKQSGGHLQIESQEGRGTRIDIYLPCHTSEGAETEDTAEPLAPRGGREETILVCEDDPGVRAYTADLLGELGYDVIEAGDAAATLALLSDSGRRVDLLFTDVVLPGGVSGAELADRARAIRPDLKILYTTGYARDAIVHDGRLDPGIELVAKPFSAADLAARVREMLDRS